jgi:NADH-quinone oxidoreductase subunit I
VYDIDRLLKGPPVSHPSDPWYKRGSSEEPDHVHKEAHTRIGEGLVPLRLPSATRIEVDTTHPVAVTRFIK